MEAAKFKRIPKFVLGRIEYYIKLPFYALFYFLQLIFSEIFKKDNLILHQTSSIKRIQIKDKNILIVVSHVDDETLFAGSVLLSEEPKSKNIIVVHNGTEDSNNVLQEIGKLSDCKIYHLKQKEKFGPTNELASLSKEAKETFINFIKKFFTENDIDIIFTHNEFGEYGHGQHREVHKIVKETLKESGLDKIEFFTFGYAYPMLYAWGKTCWPETLRAFSNISKWRRFNLKNVFPFSGIFKTKKYGDFFYFESNFYYPQLKKKKLLYIVDLYRKCRGTWRGWTRRWTQYYNFATNDIQYFSLEKEYTYKTIYYNFHWFIIRQKEPIIFKGKVNFSNFLKKIVMPNDSVRTFHDRFLVDYLKLNGKLLWIGWNKFCQKSKYKKRMKKYANSIEILDNQEPRKDKKIYGKDTADFIGDLCDLSGVINNEIYDSIHCNGVLEYVSDIPNAISELARILKKQGRLFLGLPGKDYWVTGENRPDFEYIIDLLNKNNLIPIEVWRRYNPDYYFIHVWKK